MEGIIPHHSISGKTGYEFATKAGRIPHHNSMLMPNASGSFSLGYQIKKPKINSVHWCRAVTAENPLSGGNPNQPIDASIITADYKGKLRIYLSDGSKFLVYETVDPVLRSSKAVTIDILWDGVNKDIIIYIEAVTRTTIINTSLAAEDSAKFYSNKDDFTTVNHNITADIWFGKSVGFSRYTGQYFGGYYINKLLTNSEITNKWNEIKDTSAEPDTGKIVFISDRSESIKKLHTMTGNGENQSILLESIVDYARPRYSADGSKIIFEDEDASYVRQVDSDGSNAVSWFHSLSYLNNHPVILNNGFWLARDGESITISRNRTANTDFSDGLEYGGTINGDIASEGAGNFPLYIEVSKQQDKMLWLVTADATGTITSPDIGNSTVSLMKGDLSSTEEFLNNIVTNEVELIAFSQDTLCRRPRFNFAGTKIGYSSKDVNGNWQLFWVDVNGGTPEQLTGDNFNSYFESFSPDDLYALYSQDKNGKQQLYKINLSTLEKTPVSVNSYNDYDADWIS